MLTLLCDGVWTLFDDLHRPVTSPDTSRQILCPLLISHKVLPDKLSEEAAAAVGRLAGAGTALAVSPTARVRLCLAP